VIFVSILNNLIATYEFFTLQLASVEKKEKDEEEDDTLNKSGVSFHFVPPSPSVCSLESADPEDIILTDCKEDPNFVNKEVLITESKDEVEEDDIGEECSCHKCRTEENRHSYSNSSMDEEEAAVLLKSVSKEKQNKTVNNKDNEKVCQSQNINKVVEVTVHQGEADVQLRRTDSHNHDSDSTHNHRNSNELAPSDAKLSSSEEEKTDEETCEVAKLVSKGKKEGSKSGKGSPHENKMTSTKVSFKQNESEIIKENNNEKPTPKRHLWKSREKFSEKWNKTTDRDSISSISSSNVKTSDKDNATVKNEVNGIKDKSNDQVQLKSYNKTDWTNSSVKPNKDKISELQDNKIVPEKNTIEIGRAHV